MAMSLLSFVLLLKSQNEILGSSPKLCATSGPIKRVPLLAPEAAEILVRQDLFAPIVLALGSTLHRADLCEIGIFL